MERLGHEPADMLESPLRAADLSLLALMERADALNILADIRRQRFRRLSRARLVRS
jgi:hypothetical protein